MAEQFETRQQLLEQIITLRQQLHTADLETRDRLSPELKRLEDALCETNEVQQLVVNSSHDWLKLLDLDGNVISMSHGGMPLVELQGVATAVKCSWIEWWHGDERKAALDALEVARRGQIGGFTARCSAGKGRWLDVIVVPIPNATGEIESLMAISRDVTHFKKLEEELQQKNQQLLEANDELQIADDELKRQNAELQSVRAEIAKERERYRELFEFAPDGYLVTDDQARIQEANQAAAAQLRTSPARLVGQHLTGYVAPEERREFTGRLLAAAEQSEPVAWELRLCPATGNAFDAELMVTATSTAVHPAGYRWLIRDASARKRIERALRETESRLRRLVESNVVGVVYADESGAIMDGNDAFLGIVGYDRDDLLAHKLRWDTMTPPEFRAIDEQAIVEAKARGAFSPREKEYIRKDGTRVPVLLGGALIGNGAAEYICFVLDMTELKRTEAALRESEQRYRTIGESIPYGVWVASAEGRLQYASRSLLELIGLTIEEARDFGWTQAIRPEMVDEAIQCWLRCVRTGEDWDSEFDVKRVDGQWRTVLSRGKPVRDPNGRITSWVGINLDITDRKQAEAVLARQAQELQRKAQELTASNEELQQYAYVISHDLRSPLLTISGSLELLGEEVRDKLAPESREHIENALASVGHMKVLISALLEYGRVGMGGLRVSEVSAESVLDKVIHNMSADIGQVGARVTHDPLPCVRADEALMMELLQNLLENALKYHGPDPPHIHIAAAEQERTWQFSVADNGIGIEPRDYDRIFRLFDRLGAAETASGTGIGLATCKKIVERHGGHIWVESEPGRGSTFYFTLPR